MGKRAGDLGTVYPRVLNGRKRGWAGQVNEVINGRRKRHTVYGATEKEVIKKLKEKRRWLEERGSLPDTDVTLAVWLNLWLDEHVASRVKPQTARSYRSAVTHWIIPAIGNVKLSRLSAANIRAVHRYVMTDLKLSSTAAYNAHRILAIALRDAERDDRILRNVAKNVTPPRPAASQRRNLTADQAKNLLRAVGTDPLAARWLIALLYGPRQGECLGLRWSSIGTEQITLEWQLQRIPWLHGCGGTCERKQARSCPKRRMHFPTGMEYEILDGNLALTRPKSLAGIRVLPRLPIVDAALDLRLATVEAERPRYLADHDLVFCRPNGLPLDAKADWNRWQELLRTAGIDKAPLHAARHTTATLLMELGVDAKVVASIIGHSDVITTRAYQHVDTSLARAALSGVAERLELGSAADG